MFYPSADHDLKVETFIENPLGQNPGLIGFLTHKKVDF